MTLDDVTSPASPAAAPPALRDHLPTLALMAAFAYLAETGVHEHLGHAAICAALGGHVRAFGAFYVDCDYRAMSAWGVRWVAYAGPLASLATGLIAGRLLGHTRGTLPRLFLWLLASLGYMTASGYMLFSAVGNIGDLSTGPEGGLHGLPAPWLLRALMGVTGYWLYQRTVVWSMRRLWALLGSSEAPFKRLSRVSHVVYAAGCAASVAIGLLNPMGWIIVLASAGAASLGGTSGFAWGPGRARRLLPALAETPHPIPRSIGWMLASVGFLIIYAAVFGPSLMR